jgi:para-aminobenzoate synthetase component I
MGAFEESSPDSGTPTEARTLEARDGRVEVRLPPGRTPSPFEALLALRAMPHRVLLESRGDRGRFSFLAAAPRRVIFLRDGEEDPFAVLDGVLAEVGTSARNQEGPSPFCSFAGGVVGYLGYEAGWALERLPEPAPDDVGLPGSWFGIYDWALVWDREGEGCRLVGTVLPAGDPEGLRVRMEDVAARLAVPEDGVAGRVQDPPPAGSPRSSLEREAYMAGVDRIREYIRAGDLFQANLTRRISVESALPAEELYRRLSERTPAPYAAFIETGEGEVVSASPEQFLSVRGREATTRPIKGTAPRGGTPEDDRRMREALLASEKDRAENVMIVDLLRNDLSRVCDDGSVEVPSLLALESHPTVHHLVSTVRGRLREGVGPVDLLRATFPGGSVTGAPKIRAMEILRELEPVRRGVYTGALGVVGFGGDMELSIPIRTAVRREGRVHYGTGGGITLASDPEEEWRETEDKARAFLRAVGVEDEASEGGRS